MNVMKRAWAITIIAALMFSAPAAAGERAPDPQRTGDLWRTFVQRVPIGSVVKIRTQDGERLTAILFVVDEAGMIVKPKTRYAEPARRIAFERLDNVEVQRPGVNYGKAAAIGAGVGASVLLLLFLSAR
jgi:hypothetical protein